MWLVKKILWKWWHQCKNIFKKPECMYIGHICISWLLFATCRLATQKYLWKCQTQMTLKIFLEVQKDDVTVMKILTFNWPLTIINTPPLNVGIASNFVTICWMDWNGKFCNRGKSNRKIQITIITVQIKHQIMNW